MYATQNRYVYLCEYLYVGVGYIEVYTYMLVDLTTIYMNPCILVTGMHTSTGTTVAS
jgi:hypothetical protein